MDTAPGSPSEWGKPLERLVSRYGVVNTLRRGPSPRGLAALSLAGATLGSGAPGVLPGTEQMTAGGRALGSPAEARALALAEAAERYSGWERADTGHLLATAAGLDGPTLDPRRFPRCSDHEYAQVACPVAPYEPDTPIRWTRGVDFFTGDDIWVPACMATYRLPDRTSAERFWYPISTGSAVHSDPAAAVFAAMSEVVERDAIALIWLHRLPLPRIPAEAVGDEVGVLLDWCAHHFIDAYLFDATTDIGLPITYAVLRSRHDPVLHTILGCSAGLSTTETAFKALLEAISLRVTLSTDTAPIEDFGQFQSVSDGARYSGRIAYASAFDFLTARRADRTPYREAAPYAHDAGGALERLRPALLSAGTQAALVDRTTDELADVGLIGVRAVLPGLQPMSLHPLARFTRHRRVHEAPQRMGYPVAADADLNPLPQPFA